MIIKKPYAFLIKNFRIIHGILFVLLLYLTIKSFNIYTFFSNYARTHMYVNQANLASHYVDLLMIFVCILAIIVSSIIYYILSIKNKENKMYLAIVLYYILLIIFYIYCNSVFNSLQEKSLSIESVRALRDISIIVIIPQLIILFIIFLRALGFNVRQFDFKKDLEELEIDVSDNEEVEVTLGSDTYKIARFFRKLLRLTKYFVLENKFFVISVFSAITIAICYAIYSKYNIYRVTYEQSQELQALSLKYVVNESYITNTDINNTIIKDNKTFILVKTKITNNSRENYILNRETFRLKVGKELLFPSFNYNNKFNDIGDLYNNCEIVSGEEKEVLVVFELNDSDIKKDYLFKVKNYNNISRAKNESEFKDIIIEPISLNKNVDKGTYVLPNEIKFDETILKNSSMIISSFDVAEKFKEKYNYTINGEIKSAIYSIIPSSTNKHNLSIVKFKATIKLDESIYANNIIKVPADLFDKYGLIRYRYQGNYKLTKMSKISVDYEKDSYSYLEVPKEVENANKIELIILIRGYKYTIILK